MTTFQALSLIAQFSLATVTLLSFIVTIVVMVIEKKK